MGKYLAAITAVFFLLALVQCCCAGRDATSADTLPTALISVAIIIVGGFPSGAKTMQCEHLPVGGFGGMPPQGK